jgi:hypothetical protein
MPRTIPSLLLALAIPTASISAQQRFTLEQVLSAPSPTS